jgi:glucosamine--fructose-6-phosphate aminotransferase (isomerizing)
MQPSAPRIVSDIEGQSASLARVLQQHCGAGRAPLLEAAALLRSSARSVVVGIGASLNASIALDYLLCARGCNSRCVEAGEFLHYRHESGRGAAVVVVSRSGESIEIARLLSALQGRAAIVAVTSGPRSTLARAADIVLEVCSLPDEMVAIQSYTGTLLTLYLLGMAVAQALDEAQQEVEVLLRNFPGWIAANLAEPSTWDEFLERDAPIYTLARGPSLGSALQGALLFNEIAKAPAIGMAVASFRHGPIEVVDQRFRALVFASRGRTRDLNVGLARDLVRFGGQVRLIGPDGSDGSGLQWIHTPPCSELLAPLVEIVPVQVAAMRLAQLRGIVVGSFRYAAQVTVDEACVAGPETRGTRNA